jgi:hypothetical protein
VFTPLSSLKVILLIFYIPILTVAPIVHCDVARYVTAGAFILEVSSTSALFFLRVRAVYCNKRIITVFFGLLWLILFGLCFIVPLATKAGHMGRTQICTIIQIDHYIIIPLLVQVVFDTLVFLAISLRLLSFSIVGDTFGARVRSCLRGDGLPSLSRSLLYGGQVYYSSVTSSHDRHTLMFLCSAAISLDIALVVMIFSPVVPPLYPCMFFMSHLALDSAMACRVFRGIKLGYIQDVDDETALRFRTHKATVASADKSQDNMHNLAPSSHNFVINVTKTARSGEP